MKNLTNKKMWQKIIISIAVVIMVFNVVNPTIVAAKDPDYGVLFAPIQAATTGLGDILMSIVNLSVGGRMPAVITLEQSLGETLLNVLAAATAVAGMIIAGVTGHVEFIAPLAKGFLVATGVSFLAGKAGWTDLGNRLEIPCFPVTPETIFSGKVPLLDINIINPLYKDSAAYTLQTIVASWYNTFRMIAIVGLLSALVYIAIRIVLSAAADDKAKYKVMLKDWLVGFCLLFFMHYIMSFATTIVETVTYIVPVDWYTVIKDEDGNVLNLSDLKDKYGEFDGGENTLIFHTTGYRTENDSSYTYDGDSEDLSFNFMEYIRFNAQTSKWGKNDDILSRFTYTLMYLILAIYTILFLFVYVKRLIYIIFLTMGAPLVALTYPLDKVKDGSAQGFNFWLREYLFNLMLQPLHLVLYYVLAYSANELILDHPIYAIIVLGLMLQVEKVVRKMFGFEKSSTIGNVTSGLLGGAAVMGGLKMLTNGVRNFGKGAKNRSSGSGAGTSGENTDYDTRQSRFRGGNGFNPVAELGTSENPPGDEPTPPDNGGPGLGGGQEDDEGGNILFGSRDQEEMDNLAKEIDGWYEQNPNRGIYEADYDDPIRDAQARYEELSKQKAMAERQAQEAEEAGNTSEVDNSDGSQSSNDIRFRWPEEDAMSADAAKWFRSPRMDNMHGAGLRTFYGAKGVIKGIPKKIINSKPAKYLVGDEQQRQVFKNKVKSDLENDWNMVKSNAKAIGAAANELGINKESIGNVAKGAAGVAGGAILGGTGAMVGMAAGFVSDNTANVAKWGAIGTTGGATAGYSAASRVAGMPSSAYKKVTTNATNARDAYIKEKYGKEEMQRMINEKLNKEHMRNKKVQKMYQDAFKNDWEKAMKASITYRNETGVTNNKLIINTMKEMSKQGKAYDSKEGLTTAKLAKNVNSRGDINYMVNYLDRSGVDKKKIKEMEKNVLKVTELE